MTLKKLITATSRINRIGLIPLYFSIFPLGAVAANLPLPHAVPGGIAVIPLEAPNPHPPRVYYQARRVMVLRHNERWLAVVGIPLSAQAGTHQLEIDGPSAQNRKSISFEVGDKQYDSQHITIKDRRKVNPNARDLERIGREKKQIDQAFSQWRQQDDVDMALSLPVQGEYSSPFGLRRFFNGQARKPHSGLDIAAPKGTPITAPAAGKVISTGEFFFNGNSVFVDHGQGLVTMYCHMDRIDVGPGQAVDRGETLGTVGMTGRVTGPHLHWSVSLNNVRIDPTLLLGPAPGSE